MITVTLTENEALRLRGIRRITGDMNLAHLENLRTAVLDRELLPPPEHLLPPPSF